MKKYKHFFRFFIFVILFNIWLQIAKYSYKDSYLKEIIESVTINKKDTIIANHYYYEHKNE